MSGKKTFLVPFVVLIVVLVTGIRSPQAGSAAPRAPVLECPVVSPIFDIQVDEVNNLRPDVVFNPRHEEFLVTWFTLQDANTWDIWAARVALDGRILSKFNVATGEAEKRRWPAVGYSPVQDEYLIVYGYEVGLTETDLYGKLVRWDGSVMSPEIKLITDPGMQMRARVAYNAVDDEYLVVYEDSPNFNRTGIAAQRLWADGAQKRSWRMIASKAGEWRDQAQVAYSLDRNHYLIVYDRWVGTTYDGAYAWTSNTMADLDADKQACAPADFSGLVDLAAGPDEFLYVWQKLLPNNDGDIYARRFAGNGTPQGSSSGFALAGKGAPEHNSAPRVAYASSSGYLVVWTDWSAKGGSNVFGRYVSAGQDSAAGDPFPLVEKEGNQEGEALACTPWGDCLLVVSDDWAPSGTGDLEIRATFIRPCPRVYLPLTIRKGP